VSLLIVDECHHVMARTYRDILDHFASAEKVTGYTATLARGDGQGLGAVWAEVAYTRSISWMVRRRYLVPPRGLAVEVPDLNLIALKGKDFKDGELGEALAESLAPDLVAAAYLKHAADRRGLGFAPTVASAEIFAKAFERNGILSDIIHGGLPEGDKQNPAPGTRRRILADHRAGVFQVLWNCMILTEGYDDPQVSCIVGARPTKSKPLYQQMAGRGLRVDPARPYEEQDCLLLDVSGMGGYHDLCTIIDLSEFGIKDDGTGKTLIELEDELDAGEGVPDEAVPYYVGETVTREFDPLGQPSTKVWLKTKGGVFFVPAGTRHFVFIMEYPEPGRWSVCTAGKTNGDGLPAITAHRGLPLDQALVWAEDIALDLGADLNKSNKAAPWRKKKPSEKFKDFASALGLKVGLDERQGALSDRVDVVQGSRRLDPIVTKVRSRT
jgi:hypothetical protein